jgi:hypothetical protein
MNSFSKFCGASVAGMLLVAGTISAHANIGHDDIALSTAMVGTKNVGTQVALNPQPLPPRCLPPVAGPVAGMELPGRRAASSGRAGSAPASLRISRLAIEGRGDQCGSP